jgi:hypothetical protein
VPGVRFRKDFLDVRHRIGPFELRDERDVLRTRIAQLFASLTYIGGGLHKTEPDIVDARGNSKLQVRNVFGGEAASWKTHTGHIDPLVLAKLASIDYLRANVASTHLLHPQLNPPVVEQQNGAGTDDVR